MMPTTLNPGKVFAGLLLAASGALFGCGGSVDGNVDGNELTKLQTVLYGEIDTENFDGLAIFMAEYPFSCEDLTQNWTPQELADFPAFNSLSLTTYDNEVKEYQLADYDNIEDSGDAALTLWDAKLEPDNLYIGEEGTITITEFPERYAKLAGEFSVTLVGDDDAEGLFEGKFKADFCRNLSELGD